MHQRVLGQVLAILRTLRTSGARFRLCQKMWFGTVLEFDPRAFEILVRVGNAIQAITSLTFLLAE
jgi:hypothetical protein